MGLGVDLAREDAPLHAAVIDNFKDQFILVLLRRLGGDVTIPVAEVDDTGGLMLAMNLTDDQKAFRFVLERKQ